MTQLEERCRELEGVIEDMTNTFIALSDTILNSGGASSGTTKELGEIMRKFLLLSEKATRDPWEAVPSSDENNEPPATDQVFEDKDFSSKRVTNAFQPRSVSTERPLCEIDPILRTEATTWQTPMIYGTNIMDLAIPNPYVNYGIWGIRPQHERTSIIPYVIAGRDSFASRLFYGSIVRGLRSLRGVGPADDAYRIFRFKFRYKSATQIQSILDGVLDTLLHGTSQKKVDDIEGPKAKHLDMSGIKAQIVREIEMMGGSEDEYLSTWDVEGYLRNKWKLSLDSNWVKIQPAALLASPGDMESTFFHGIYDKYESFAPTVIPGLSQPKQVVWDVSSLVEKLEGLTVTIGQGPRWHYKDVDTAVEAFLEENRES